MQKSRLFRPAAFAAAVLLTLTYSLMSYSETAFLLNAGAIVNSDGDDFSPSCTSDGKTIVFSSKSSVEHSHKIFTCTNTDGVWSEPYPILEVSSEANDETPFISADGQTLLFSSDRPGGFSPSATADGNKRITFDIYISRRVNGQWSQPELVAGDVNTNMNERSPSLSPDGKTIFFTRFPYRNLSKSAIYMATYENGKYVNVRALPEAINSGNYEISFIPSYKTGRYYFASMRKGGFGGWDIYYTVQNENGFAEPVNAGNTINSRYDDLFLAETGTLSVLCSNRSGGFGGYDLYASSLKKEYDTTAVKENRGKTGVTITVKDRENNLVIPQAELTIYRQQEKGSGDARDNGSLMKCDENGVISIETMEYEKWIMLKPAGKYNGNIIKVKLIQGKIQDIEILADRVKETIPPEKDKDKIKDKEKIKVKDKDRDKEKERTKDKAGDKQDDKQKVDDTDKTGDSTTVKEKDSTSSDETVNSLDWPELKPVYFAYNSTEIRTDYIPVIHGIIEFMRNHPEVKLKIKGHADNRGSKKNNMKISRLRAEKVYLYILSMGIPAERMTIIPMGETDPQTTGGRYDYALNRRVEFEFVNIEKPADAEN